LLRDSDLGTPLLAFHRSWTRAPICPRCKGCINRAVHPHNSVRKGLWRFELQKRIEERRRNVSDTVEVQNGIGSYLALHKLGVTCILKPLIVTGILRQLQNRHA
jgi:hypothetical protein